MGRRINLVKKIVNVVATISMALGMILLLLQAITVSMYLDTFNIVFEGYIHKFYYMQTLIVSLCWIFITSFEGAKNEWKGFGLLLIATALMEIFQMLQISNLKTMLSFLVETLAITIQQYRIITVYCCRGIVLTNVLTVLLKIFHVKNLQTVR